MDYKNIIYIVLILIATIKKIDVKKSKPPSNELIEYGIKKIIIDNIEHKKIYLKFPTIEIEIILRSTISSILFDLFKP